ncbi:sodium/potassium-transporting ATPase subunit gamma isoform X1 [Candoia aspera]|uniref:sodium/potassium-transporting ATPase subunit gamma isoform X1 n=1 Tax=Candoia aspera TaxID=51853 RepID=UPI002FD7F09B
MGPAPFSPTDAAKSLPETEKDLFSYDPAKQTNRELGAARRSPSADLQLLLGRRRRRRRRRWGAGWPALVARPGPGNASTRAGARWLGPPAAAPGSEGAGGSVSRRAPKEAPRLSRAGLLPRRLGR